jgi:hypothetical protein
MAGTGTKSAGIHITSVEKQRMALEARKAGATYEAIARKVGYKGISSAEYAVKTALKRMIQEPAEEVRQMELARLDSMLLGLWEKATRGDYQAIDRALKIMARRAAYLGLDAPIKFDLGKLVADVAAELDLTPEEAASTLEDVTAMLVMARVPS